MASTEKISVYNLADLKNTSDDALPNYLNSLGFKQSHALVDTRLALGYTAFFIAAACAGWDYKFGFESTKYFTAAAVAVYAMINGALSLWIAFVEKGIVYEGFSADGAKLSISTSTKDNTPIYHVKATLTPKTGPPTSLDFSKPFAQWFDSQGRFIAAPFQTVFATSVPTIGKADPQRVAAAAAAATTAGAAAAGEEYSAEVLDAIMGGEATGADAGAAGKKTKRRKA